MGHLLTENRNGLIVDTEVTEASTSQEWDAGTTMLARQSARSGTTVGADWSDAKTSPHWTSEGGLDFSIYSGRVQYYANEDPDSLIKVENSQISKVNSKHPNIIHRIFILMRA